MVAVRAAAGVAVAVQPDVDPVPSAANGVDPLRAVSQVSSGMRRHESSR
jgi:hypothetical protein